jgi:hypothetical protein
LRFTAFPRARGTVRPTRADGRDVSQVSRQNAANRRVVKRTPPSYTRRKSAVFRIRLDFGNGRPDGVSFGDGASGAGK